MKPTYRSVVQCIVLLSIFGFLFPPALAQQKPKELVVGASGVPATLDPHLQSINIPSSVFRTMFDGLTRVDERDLQTRPALAESWQLLNPTTWRFKLRRGVQFHN